MTGTARQAIHGSVPTVSYGIGGGLAGGAAAMTPRSAFAVWTVLSMLGWAAIMATIVSLFG